MKSEVQNLEGLTRRLSVEVPSDAVTDAMEKMYRDIQKVAKLKGFRPGKVPMATIKTKYQAQVESDASRDVIMEFYQRALAEHELVPVNYPQFDFDGVKDGEPLKFSATFEVRPTIEPKVYTGLKIQKEKFVLDEKQVTDVLQQIQNNKASLVPILESRNAQEGDVALIDFLGSVDGNPWEGSQGKEFMVEIGSNHVFPELEKGIIGMAVGGQSKIKVPLPADYKPEDLAGKEAVFDVTLKELKKKKLPELDDEFAKSLGGTYESLEKLKEDIRKDIEGKEQQRIKEDLRSRLLETLVEKNPVTVPQSMVGQQKQALINDIHQKMQQQGMNEQQFEEYKKKWDGEFQKSAEFMIRSSLLMDAISQKEDLKVTEADIDSKIGEFATHSGMELEQVKALYDKDDARSRLRFQMKEEKVVDFLLEKNQVEEVAKDKLPPSRK